jgi:NitT/TauT family transport system substrate-binding protein
MIIVVVLALSIAIGSFFYLNSQKDTAGELTSIDVAYSPFESTALFLVAQERDFFSQNALNVVVHNYSSGAGALEGVLKGEADITIGTTEFPLVIRALDEEKIQTMASVSESNFMYLVGRADRGISKPSDLKGKVVGTTIGTIAQYFLGRFLTLNAMNLQDVTIVDLKTPREWVDAVVNGSIDAVATAQPYANSAKEGLGLNAVVWSLHSNQQLYAQAISRREWISANPDLCVRFLRALLKAEEFAINNPTEAKIIVKQQLNFSDAYIETVWGQNQFSLSLDQSIILAMESEARWLISSNLTNQTAVPNFRDFVYISGLNSVKPQSVNIIGGGN